MFPGAGWHPHFEDTEVLKKGTQAVLMASWSPCLLLSEEGGLGGMGNMSKEEISDSVTAGAGGQKGEAKA